MNDFKKAKTPQTARSLNKTLITLALLLILTTSAFFVVLPTVAALDINTYSYISATPNPASVGENVHVIMWLDRPPPTEVKILSWENIQITITKPDGTTETRDLQSDIIGGAWFSLVPDQVGTYKIQGSFAGQKVDANGNYYKPSNTRTIELRVQQQEIPPLEEIPLPTGYWTRPISAENRQWWSISGNWLATALMYDAGYSASGNFNPYTKAPNTAHIIWTRPIADGGIVGGEFEANSYYTGESYEIKYAPVIMNGKIYHKQRLGTSAYQGLYCIDLRTGEELWFKNGTTINCGQILLYDTPNQHGAIPYLWSLGTTYKMYDAFTGAHILTLANATSGTVVFDKSGNMLVYVLDQNNKWLARWNSTKAISDAAVGVTTGWRPATGAVLDWNKGIEWNVTINNVGWSRYGFSGSGNAIWNDIIITRWYNNDTWPPITTHLALDAKTGQELWRKERTIQEDPFVWRAGGVAMGEGVYAEYAKEKLQWVGYDVYTGEQLWITEPYTNDWAFYTSGWAAQIAYGKLITGTYDGKMTAFDIKTGAKLWEYYSGDAGSETPYGTWPFFLGIPYGATVADGKVFAPTGEHSPNSVLYKGEKLHVINAETGEGVWNISGWWLSTPIADGYLTSFNGYDGQIYCFGKGQTKTTIEAPLTTIPRGTGIVIQGTVTDQSPGAKDTPAIADESMTSWMEYLYMQKPKPNDAKGVSVELTAIGPDGNTIDIGTVTTDISGMFSYMWTPPSEGKYTIMATFEGSESYWPSSAQRAIGVGPASASQSSQTPQPSQQSTNDTSLTLQTEVLLIGIGIIALVVIVAIVAFVLGKRK